MDTRRIKMKVFLLIVFATILYGDGYSKLKTYKKNNPGIVKEEKKGEFILRFKDINTFDFNEFENRYNVKFTFCIADGICAFKSQSKENMEETLFQMRQRDDLISVEIYNKYKMNIY
jgi:hypothetical protein